MSGLSRLLTSLSVQCEVRVRHGMPKGQRVFSTLEDLDAPILLKPWIRNPYVSSPFAMGIISKSVAHACSGGARGFFKPNDQEYGEAAGVASNFTAIERNQGGTFQNSGDQLGFRASTRTRQRSLEKQRKRSLDPATTGFGLSSFTGATLVRL